jgi:hypothetical protein
MASLRNPLPEYIAQFPAIDAAGRLSIRSPIRALSASERTIPRDRVEHDPLTRAGTSVFPSLALRALT